MHKPSTKEKSTDEQSPSGPPRHSVGLGFSVSNYCRGLGFKGLGFRGWFRGLGFWGSGSPDVSTMESYPPVDHFNQS